MNTTNPQPNKIYFHGKFFENLEECKEFYNDWLSQTIDQESFLFEWKKLTKDIEGNLFLIDKKFTNKDLVVFIEDLFMYSIKKMRE